MNDQLLALLQPCALIPEEAPTPPLPEAPFVLYTRRGQPVRLEARHPTLSPDAPQPSGVITLHPRPSALSTTNPCEPYPDREENHG